MSLWIFQGLIDLFLGTAFIFYVRHSRKKMAELEARAQRCEREAERLSSELAQVKTKPTENLPVKATPLSPTLIEKKVGTPTRSQNWQRTSMDSYEKAEELIQTGMDLREVSRKTGLSMSELQLLGKVLHRSH